MMRLPEIERGQSLPQRLLLGVMRRIYGGIPGPIAVMSYEQRFFGKAYSYVLEHCMRRSGEWSIPEVELFAAFVSKQNQCRF